MNSHNNDPKLAFLGSFLQRTSDSLGTEQQTSFCEEAMHTYKKAMASPQVGALNFWATKTYPALKNKYELNEAFCSFKVTPD